MKWALSELNKFRDGQLDFSETIDLSDSLKIRDHSILNVEPITVDGFLQVNREGYLAHYVAKTVITMPSSRSLEPVEIPMTLSVDEEYMTQRQYDAITDLSEDEKNLIIVLEKDLIDLSESIEDFILLNLPMQVLTEDEKQSTDYPKGDFWTVVSEDELKKEREIETTTTIDPRLAKLSELFNEDGE